MIRGVLLSRLAASAALLAGLCLAGVASAQGRGEGRGGCEADPVEWGGPAFANAVSFQRM